MLPPTALESSLWLLLLDWEQAIIFAHACVGYARCAFLVFLLVNTSCDGCREGLRWAYPISKLPHSAARTHNDNRSHFSYPPLQLLSGASLRGSTQEQFLSHPRHTQRFFATLPVATIVIATHLALFFICLLLCTCILLLVRCRNLSGSTFGRILRNSSPLPVGYTPICKACPCSCRACCYTR